MNRMRGTDNHRDYSIEEKFAWVWMVGLKSPVGDPEHNLQGPLTSFPFLKKNYLYMKRIIYSFTLVPRVTRGFLCTASLHLFIS